MHIRKKLFSSIALLFGILFFAAPTLAVRPTEGVLNNKANIRDSSGYTKVVTQLDKGTKVSIVGETLDWYQLALKNDSKGWVIKWLVNTSTPIITQKITKPKTATLLYASKIRKTPKISPSNIIQTLFPGVQVQITGSQAEWYSINYGVGKSGWIAQALVRTATTTVSAVSTTTASVQLKSVLGASLTFVSGQEINQYWQELVNGLRKANGLRELTIDSRLINTANTWAKYNGQLDTATHARPNGETAQQWIKEQGIIFTERNSVDGWKTNYFSENLGVRLNVQPSLAGVKAALNSVLQSYLKEGPLGVHYKTVYYPDWNSFGAGWHPIKNSNGTYTMYFVFHYGSLAK